MNIMKSRLEKAFATLLLSGLPLFCLADSPINPLIGIWQHASFVQIADGLVVRKYESTDGSRVEYRTDGTWRSDDPPHQSSGTYRLMSNGQMESRITNSDLPNQIGYTSRKLATVRDQTLTLVTEYDEEAMKVFAARADGTRPKSMTATSTFRKIQARK
jgi:hypothetical protein